METSLNQRLQTPYQAPATYFALRPYAACQRRPAQQPLVMGDYAPPPPPPTLPSRWWCAPRLMRLVTRAEQLAPSPPTASRASLRPIPPLPAATAITHTKPAHCPSSPFFFLKDPAPPEISPLPIPNPLPT